MRTGSSDYLTKKPRLFWRTLSAGLGLGAICAYYFPDIFEPQTCKIIFLLMWITAFALVILIDPKKDETQRDQTGDSERRS